MSSSHSPYRRLSSTSKWQTEDRDRLLSALDALTAVIEASLEGASEFRRPKSFRVEPAPGRRQDQGFLGRKVTS